jgi:hypothetical protein
VRVAPFDKAWFVRPRLQSGSQIPVHDPAPEGVRQGIFLCSPQVYKSFTLLTPLLLHLAAISDAKQAGVVVQTPGHHIEKC